MVASCMLLAKTPTLKHSSGHITPLRAMVPLGTRSGRSKELNGPSPGAVGPRGAPITCIKNGRFHMFPENDDAGVTGQFASGRRSVTSWKVCGPYKDLNEVW
uniref:Uncharacterized protein n=1 Tax=Glossina morsitans morsitans TaxID=37546 RepID=A0A1B0GET7_GLOMM